MIWFLIIVISFSLAIYTMKKLEDYVPLWFVLLAGFVALIPLIDIGAILVCLFFLGQNWVNSDKIQTLLEKKIL